MAPPTSVSTVETGSDHPAPALLGFGEAAIAFARGWRTGCDRTIYAFDIKTQSPQTAIRAAKLDDYRQSGVIGCDSASAVAQRSDAIFSLVTADQALAATASVAASLRPGSLYFDGNSCAPQTKRRCAALIDAADGHYIDVAIMAPVAGRGHQTPLLLSGPHASAASIRLAALGMQYSVVGDAVGAASTIKMVRSVMIKGQEALTAECLLAARLAGVDEAVIRSLEQSGPVFDWRRGSAYRLERMAIHGLRRAAEMREVARTLEDLGLPATMSAATAEWQARIGNLQVAGDASDLGATADLILHRLVPPASQTQAQGLPSNPDGVAADAATQLRETT